jgi:hypothetical protein
MALIYEVVETVTTGRLHFSRCVILITYKKRTEREDGFGQLVRMFGDVEPKHNKLRQWGMDSRELVRRKALGVCVAQSFQAHTLWSTLRSLQGLL